MVCGTSLEAALNQDWDQLGRREKELHIDRAYLSSHLVRERNDELEIYCKAWPVRISKQFHKQAFVLDWEQQIIRCPAGQQMPFVPGGTVHFPKEACEQCPLKAQCTTSSQGRSVSIHPDEALLIELRQRQQTDASTGQTARASGSPSIPSHMSVDGKDDAHAIVDSAKTSLICVDVPSSTISTSWLVPNQVEPH